MGHDWFVHYQPFLATPVDDDNARNSIICIIKNLVKVVRYVPCHVHNLKKHFLHGVEKRKDVFETISYLATYDYLSELLSVPQSKYLPTDLCIIFYTN